MNIPDRVMEISSMLRPFMQCDLIPLFFHAIITFDIGNNLYIIHVAVIETGEEWI